jgi:hypothetical protein
MVKWESGQLPKGGFRSIIPFCGDGYYDTKQSPTSGGGKKIY